MKIFDLMFIMALIPFAINITCQAQVGGVSVANCGLSSPTVTDGNMVVYENLNDTDMVDLSNIKDESGSGSFITGFKTARNIAGLLVSSVSIGSVIQSFWSNSVPIGVNPPVTIWILLDYIGYFIYTVGLASLVIRMRLQD